MNLFNDHLNLSNNIYDNAKILKSVELNKQQELVNRNPTTKYYQTLAQNLQEQVQYLKRQLNEAADRGLGVVYPGDVQNQIMDLNPGSGNGDPTNPQNTVLYGPNYRWPDPITGYNMGTGLGRYFPKGLSPTVGPNPNSYPGGTENLRYQDDMRRWREAVKTYYNANRPTRLIPRVVRGIAGGINNAYNRLNEADAPGPTQFPPEFQPPLLAPADFQVPLETPTNGPIYNFPPGPNLGQGSGGMRDFFPSGLSRTVGPNPSDYPGGDRNLQYQIHMQQWIIACRAYDRVHGKPRQSLGGAPVSQFVRKVRRFLHTPGQ